MCRSDLIPPTPPTRQLLLSPLRPPHLRLGRVYKSSGRPLRPLGSA